jgi:DNA-directed RNA polymerase subunit F
MKKRTCFFAVLALMVMVCFTAHASQPLAGFAGYYQLDNNKDMYLQIMVKDNKLVLKQLWDEREIPFEQKSDLKFYNDQESFPLTFSKNANGEITQLLAFERDTWIKVKDYKPEEKKEIKLTPEKMRAFTGKYKMSHDGDDAFVQFTVNGNSLEAKELWSGKTYVIVPQSDLVFFGRKVYYPVQFTKDKNGNVTQALIFNKDVWVKVKE